MRATINDPSVEKVRPPLDSSAREMAKRLGWWLATIALFLLIYPFVQRLVWHRGPSWLGLLSALGALSAGILHGVLFRLQLTNRPDGPFSPSTHLTR